MTDMTHTSSLRAEAQDPTTPPRQLHELIHLPGDRRAHDSDAGWCREDVAANPSTSLATLHELAQDEDDLMARFHVANNPSVDLDTLRHLAEDRIDMIANAARKRLGLSQRPAPGPRIPYFDPRVGRLVP